QDAMLKAILQARISTDLHQRSEKRTFTSSSAFSKRSFSSASRSRSLAGSDRGKSFAEKKGGGSKFFSDVFVGAVKQKPRHLSISSVDQFRRKKAHDRASERTQGIDQSETTEDTSFRPRETLGWLLERPISDISIFIVILMSVISIGIEADMTAQRPLDDIPLIFEALNLFYTVVFAIEIALKWAAFGLYMYFTGPDKVWNVFDFVIVTSSILDQSLSFWVAHSDGETFALKNLRVIRMLRVTRIVRGIRVMRVLRYVQPLRTLLRSIYTVLKSLVWTMILLALIFYSFGVAFTQSTSDYCREAAGALLQPGSGLSLSSVSPMCENPELQIYWSFLASSMFTLFKAIAGGVSWHSVVLPLEPVGWFIIVLFVAFICFTSFAVLNVITGVFCQSAMESANLDNEIAVMQQLASREEHVEAIKKLFNAIDQDASNDITMDEFEEKLEDARVIAYLDCMGIDCSDAWTLFQVD
ncbi:unnamed protein product, partial [Polarella glacialis]